MSRSAIVRCLNPWLARREELKRQLELLRARDGDNCRRCRRPIRFDLPARHDRGPILQPMDGQGDGDASLDNLCLCHGRCNAEAGDNTQEVQERMRLRA